MAFTNWIPSKIQLMAESYHYEKKYKNTHDNGEENT
jgi:hypothetical protein